MTEPREAPLGHESPGVDTRRVVGVSVGLGILIAVALVAIWLVMRFWIVPDYVQLHTKGGLLPPQPRLQPHPGHDLAVLRAEKAHLLSGYAWTGKSHDFAQIPIQRAMQIYAQKRGPGTGDRGGFREPGTRKQGAGNREQEPASGTSAADSGRQP